MSGSQVFGSSLLALASGCQRECHPHVYLRNDSARPVLVKLPHTGPRGGTGAVPAGETREVFTSWSVGAEEYAWRKEGAL